MTRATLKALCAAGFATLILMPLAARADQIIDLTSLGNVSGTFSTDSSGGTVIYSYNFFQTSGTGSIDSFVRLGTNGTTEQGYNTSGGTPLDTKSGMFTHDLALGAMTATGGYYAFTLDINQNGNELLSLDDVQLYAGAGGQTTTTINGDGTLPLGTLLYRMDRTAAVASDNTVLLKFTNGSGAGEMLMFVPTSIFAGYGPTQNIILYSHFGGYMPPTYETNDGFEEWANITLGPPGASTPEPATMVTLATMLGVAGCFAYRWNRGRKVSN